MEVHNKNKLNITNNIMNQDIRFIKGVGPRKSERLAKLGIKVLEDALYYYPREYDIWNDVKPISDILDGEECSLVVEFVGNANTIRTRRGLTITNLTAKDDTGSAVCVWYNQTYRATAYKPGKKYFIRGKADIKYHKIQIQTPLVQEYDPQRHNGSRIMPVYPLTQGLTQRDIQNIIKNALVNVNNQLVDYLPASIREKYNLAEKNFAIYNIHFPQSNISLQESRNRLVFDEFFNLRMALKLIRQTNKETQNGIIFNWDTDIMTDFIKSLPFNLTDAQIRVLKEIFVDLRSGKAMNRLVQGDVGCGKTILAALALYCAYLSGYQGAMMVPTEILAQQHFSSLTDLFKDMGIKIECLVGGTKQSQKTLIKQRLADGDIDIIISTHAILEDDIVFKSLGLVVTDEQHRFGVRQRAILREKGQYTHMLVMSATPIPRTLSLILYGDLDISVVDELPPGRKPVKTYNVPSSMRNRVYEFIRKQVKEGRQAYVVCPLVEESDKIESVAATEIYNKLKKGHLSSLNVGLLHGKMKPSEKEAVMGQFAAGYIDVLVSTTVIEVGVNVVNATLMIIENAERFGLAQLHQLRGRVGRGKHQSYCVLVADANTREIQERMDIMVKSNNGFDIAEKDLQLRGPGDLFGIRQHGLPEFKIANLATDIDILKKAQNAVDDILEEKDSDDYKPLIEYVMHKFNQKVQEIALN